MGQCKQKLPISESMCYHTDMQSADFYLVYNEEFRSVVKSGNESPRTMAIGSARLEALAKLSCQAYPWRLHFRPRVMYVLGLMYGDANRSNWTDTQTFRWQQKLVRALSACPQFNIVIKGLAASDGVYNPLPDFVRDLSLSHCTYRSRGKFSRMLRNADVFLFDFYSTAMEEALITDKPIIFFPDPHRPLPPGINNLKKRVFWVNREQELIDTLNETSKKEPLRNNFASNEFVSKYILPLASAGGAAGAAVKVILDKVNHGCK